MPEFRINMNVRQRGVLFSASQTKAAAARAVVAINDALADETVIRIKSRLDTVLQNPTGYYKSNVKKVNRQIYRGVSDSNVVYGGWLEGVAKNNQGSRFKGYRTFRIVRQGINRDKERIAAPMVRRLAGELNA